ncbi:MULTISPECIES: GHMP family kinase ATP-binding protein [Bacillus cereus group]|uniref:GHMP family kinase ATP-binding protein n=1 Tax=Bacillus cereus group TaxID=86661 RepID=UPI00397F2431
MNFNIEPFICGNILNNKHLLDIENIYPIKDHITLLYPSRLNAMALNPNEVTQNQHICKAGEIVFSIPIFKKVTVSIIPGNNEIKISDNTKRSSLVKHAALLMRKSLGFKESIEIRVDSDLEIKHCGLGSSSATIAAVATAINELYGNPYDDQNLIQFIAQNHGEEIEGNSDYLIPVQCIGGSAVTGMTNGGSHIITGESTVITSVDLDSDYSVIIAIPKGYKESDAKNMMEKEMESFDKFKATAEIYSKEIAFRMLHEVIPEIKNNNIRPLGDLIFDYRFNMGSIVNCSFSYPPIIEMAEKIKFLYLEGFCDVLSMSSVGPGMFAITKHKAKCIEALNNAGFNTIETSIYNGKYQII